MAAVCAVCQFFGRAVQIGTGSLLFGFSDVQIVANCASLRMFIGVLLLFRVVSSFGTLFFELSVFEKGFPLSGALYNVHILQLFPNK